VVTIEEGKAAVQVADASSLTRSALVQRMPSAVAGHWTHADGDFMSVPNARCLRLESSTDEQLVLPKSLY